MAYGGVLIQSPVPTCTEHEDEELTVLCYTCIQRICDICLKTEHMQHDWKSLAKVIREVRMNSKERETALLGFLAEIQEAALNKESKEEIKRVRVTEGTLIRMIHHHANKLVDMLQQGEEGEGASIEVTELEEMIHFFSIYLKDAHESVIFETEEAFLRICQTHKTRQQRPKLSPKFREREITEEAISDIFGEVKQEDNNDDKDDGEDTNDNGEEKDDIDDEEKAAEKPKNTTDVKQSTTDDDERKDNPVQTKKDDSDVDETKRTITEIANFTYGTKSIKSIAPISATHAWINEYQTRQTDCVDMNGHVTDAWKRDIAIDDFIVLDNGDFIYTHFGNKTIQRALKSGKTKKVCSTSPLFPVGIFIVQDGGILICLCESHVSQITPETRGEIHHMKLSGKIIRKYTRSEDGKTKLFTQPHRVTQNINNDICVVDWLDKYFTSRLVVLTVKGMVRFVYRGQSTLKKRFVSDDVCCDTYGRILVTDLHNYAVHQLSPDGQFLQLLLTKQDLPQGPKALALHGDSLWVGCEEGAVKVYKYR